MFAAMICFCLAAIQIPYFPDPVSIGAFIFCLVLGIINVYLA